MKKRTNGSEGTTVLSAREYQVLDLLIQGCYYSEIGERLEISYATVHTHIRHIYRKYQVRSRGQAVAKFLMRRGAAGCKGVEFEGSKS